MRIKETQAARHVADHANEFERCLFHNCEGSYLVSDRIARFSCAATIMSIIQNKKAFHDFFIEERFEGGLVLEGWEVKAIRAGRAQLKEAYIVVKDAELFLIGAHISPLTSTSTHVTADPVRTRKLLLHAGEIEKLVGKVERAGYTLVPLDLHYLRGRIKVNIGLAKGKKQHDKRQTEKDKDWQREQQRLLRQRA
jgi:SsrA-binding protein